jgi:hypothetical protein
MPSTTTYLSTGMGSTMEKICVPPLFAVRNGHHRPKIFYRTTTYVVQKNPPHMMVGEGMAFFLLQQALGGPGEN